MTKGTTSFGARHGRTHVLCRRCGKNAWHLQWKRCASCAYPRPTSRRFNWSVKSIKRKTTGTGRKRHMKVTERRTRNNFKTTKA